MQRCCSTAIYVDFPQHLDYVFIGRSRILCTGWRWRYSVGPGAASAESCTHPAKRDHCFPPPIAERQRLPNVGINELHFKMTYQNHTHQGVSWTVMCPHVRKTYCMWISESASSWMAHNNFKLEFGHWSWDWRNKTMDYHMRWHHVNTCCRLVCAYHAYVTIRGRLGVTCFGSRHFVNKVSGLHFSAEKQGKSEGFDSCDQPCNLKLDSNRQFFRPCDSEIWWMTSKNNRALLLYYVKLCASFQIHWWTQTGFTVQKRSIRVEIGDMLSVWPWNLTDDLGKQ